MPNLPRPEKILLAMYRLSGGTTRPLEYEDIVVQAWKLFPRDFGLRKYIMEYPDASDVHKPLYGLLKNQGFVLAANKRFRLTDRGIEYAKQVERTLEHGLEGDTGDVNGDKLSRDKEAELKRILDTDAFRYFAAGNPERILDTDFYAYLGTTVRCDRQDFLGRFNTVSVAVADAKAILSAPRYQIVGQLHDYVCERFKDILARKGGKT